MLESWATSTAGWHCRGFPEHEAVAGRPSGPKRRWMVRRPRGYSGSEHGGPTAFHRLMAKSGLPPIGSMSFC